MIPLVWLIGTAGKAGRAAPAETVHAIGATRVRYFPKFLLINSVCSPSAGTAPYWRALPSWIAAGAGMCTGPVGVPTVTRRRCGWWPSNSVSLMRPKAMS